MSEVAVVSLILQLCAGYGYDNPLKHACMESYVNCAVLEDKIMSQSEIITHCVSKYDKNLTKTVKLQYSK